MYQNFDHLEKDIGNRFSDTFEWPKEKPLNEMRSSSLSLKPFFVRKIPLWKRMMDIVGSIAGLLFFSPLFIMIAVLIQLSSHGPVFFRQCRVGCGGKLFNLYKFRTMDIDVDSSKHQAYLCELIDQGSGETATCMPMTKLDDDDPKIFAFGKILRKTYLDELPQLINVLRGDMSLVGPRPPIPYEVEQYLRWHKSRFDAVPGMTGLWQVSGKNRLTFKEMIRLDIQYAKTVSLLSDIKIIIKTPFAIMSELK